MNADKQHTGHVAKPLTPALSAAFHRAQKSPLTPRLATPGGYRTPKRLLTPSEHPSSAPSSKRDPEPSLLSANVTPRSGSRASRRDGPASSPNSTPGVQQSPHVSWAQPQVGQVSNTGRLRTERSPVRGALLEPRTTTRARTVTMESNTSRPNSSSDNAPGGPMFFHASDARSTSAELDPRPKLPSKPPSTTFIYANGAQERQTAVSEVGGTTYKRRSTGLARSVVSSKPSASPRLRPARVDSNPRLSDGPSQVSSLDDSFEAGSQVHSPPLSTVSARPVPAVRHMKSSSLDSANSGLSPPHREGLRPSPLLISSSELRVDTNNIASEPLPGLRPRVFSNGSVASVDTHNSGMQSPSKSESGQGNNGALNARTERKILDLEISNSSLLAINRTLEREMRKQNAELRRYRRLSRSGRLSMAPSSRSVSLSIPTEIEEGSEHSSVRSPEEMSDFSDEESMEDGVMSPSSQAEQDPQHRAQDEKRFLIDLAKHQELLADSQRMNQSLKRCLGWTEELIREGQRALEYNVHVNDIKLGGRVLNPEEMNELNELHELEELARAESESPSEGGSHIDSHSESELDAPSEDGHPPSP
ncbi:hypothetical protein BO70DRAFT_372341 [Aspergillus heteromorphus CBS 117.55]|uniref:Uncharacterized protein n=1 Tax=Aspergillus heteromorphus CBS 117.55 TaxID=1448321 RepID=A0A317VRK2_9EURO|nr:uncharacterized protein BO70DRAFT_372341 [Aspergillus heteromorphus CBS 117.55]PWY77024.1 hypothetical protein BO70DRAFT_372341 [Aspergillus heteromorphus CBS 117.55]